MRSAGEMVKGRREGEEEEGEEGEKRAAAARRPEEKPSSWKPYLVQAPA